MDNFSGRSLSDKVKYIEVLSLQNNHYQLPSEENGYFYAETII